MKRNIALGTSAFVLAWLCLGVALEAGLDFINLKSPPASFVATHLVALPIGLLLGRRVGRPTHLSVLLASEALAVFMYAAVIFILDAIARPAGGQVPWSALLSPTSRRATLFGVISLLLMPQLWLWLLNRLAANNSFKPTPLRGAA